MAWAAPVLQRASGSELSPFEAACTIYVQETGIYETEKALRRVFERYGKVVHCSISHRLEQQGVQERIDKSFALVTMGDEQAAQHCMAQIPASRFKALKVARFDDGESERSTALTSTCLTSRC